LPVFKSDKPEIIYLKTDPQIAYNRILKRMRKDEVISMEYLEQCHHYHENFLHTLGSAILEIDGNAPLSKESKEKIKKFVSDLNQDTSNYKLMFDGGSRGNPGLCGIGGVIFKDDVVLTTYEAIVSQFNTNNYAEYMALIRGLKVAKELNIKKIKIEGDSKLVIEQVNGNWKVKAKGLIPLHKEIAELKTYFSEITFSHIKRKYNTIADNLANIAMDKEES